MEPAERSGGAAGAGPGLCRGEVSRRDAPAGRPAGGTDPHPRRGPAQRGRVLCEAGAGHHEINGLWLDGRQGGEDTQMLLHPDRGAATTDLKRMQSLFRGGSRG